MSHENLSAAFMKAWRRFVQPHWNTPQRMFAWRAFRAGWKARIDFITVDYSATEVGGMLHSDYVSDRNWFRDKKGQVWLETSRGFICLKPCPPPSSFTCYGIPDQHLTMAEARRIYEWTYWGESPVRTLRKLLDELESPEFWLDVGIPIG